MYKENTGVDIKTVIKKNMADYQFSVARLADDIGISYSYLYQVVVNLYQMTPHCLIETIKMESAINMISQGHKMTHIYKELGYGNIRSFRHAFSKRMNMNFRTCRSKLENCVPYEKEIKRDRYISKLWFRTSHSITSGKAALQ